MIVLAALLAAFLAALLSFAAPARASVSSAGLDAVAAEPAPGAALPLDLTFADEAGRPLSLATALGQRPGVLIFADYTCHTLCGPILDFTAAALDRSGLTPGTDFRLVVVGLDPKDGLDAARAMKARIGESGAIAAGVFLSGTQAAIGAATAALGYRYTYDAEHDQFAHPAAVFILDSAGKVARVLSGVGISPADLRLALVEAGRGRVGTFADHLRLLCYGYDPTRGLYTERITLFLQIGAGAMLLGMAGGISLMLTKAKARP